MTIEDSQLEEVSKGSKKEVNLRYGIVEYDDMLRDLEHWETLLTSSFMQRPHTILTEENLSVVAQA